MTYKGLCAFLVGSRGGAFGVRQAMKRARTARTETDANVYGGFFCVFNHSSCLLIQS